jgi:hypothetical protein
LCAASVSRGVVVLSRASSFCVCQRSLVHVRMLAFFLPSLCVSQLVQSLAWVPCACRIRLEWASHGHTSFLLFRAARPPRACTRILLSLSRWGVRARARPRPPPARACAKSLARESTPIVRVHCACHARSREAMARRAGLGAENLLSALNMNILRFTWRYTLDSNRLLR